MPLLKDLVSATTFTVMGLQHPLVVLGSVILPYGQLIYELKIESLNVVSNLTIQLGCHITLFPAHESAFGLTFTGPLLVALPCASFSKGVSIDSYVVLARGKGSQLVPQRFPCTIQSLTVSPLRE